jgi:hypothetical protein
MGKIHKTQSGKRQMGRYIRERGQRHRDSERVRKGDT